MRSLAFLIVGMMLIGCEGKEGPMGPPGPPATFNLILIEESFTSNDYDEDSRSFYVYDSRIKPRTVTNIFVKKFYTNTGDPYYTPISSWVALENSRVITQVRDGSVRLFDPSKEMESEIVVIGLID